MVTDGVIGRNEELAVVAALLDRSMDGCAGLVLSGEAGVGKSTSGEGTAVRYVRAIFVPEDETCFHVFEAVSHEAMRTVSERAGFPAQRIVRAIGVQPIATEPERRMQ